MHDWQQRVIDELGELSRKILKLSAFINSDQFLSLDKKEQYSLMEQFVFMTNYGRVLDERIKVFKE